MLASQLDDNASEDGGIDGRVDAEVAAGAGAELLAERGDLALHGSVVAAGGSGVLFCGPTGRGKSTLALLASRLGHPVLSEDGAIVELRGGAGTAARARVEDLAPASMGG